MEPLFWFILSIIGALFGATVLFGKNPLKASLGKAPAMLVGVALLGVGIWGAISYFPGGVSTASVTDAQVPAIAQSTLGTLSVVLHDGQTNTSGTAVTTEDYYNDDNDFLTFYSADANIADAEEYRYNVTLERSSVTYASSVKVSCTIPDKEISGVTADNIAEKTSGKVDLTYNAGATSTGNFADDNTVWTYVTFAEGDGSQELLIAFDQEETYHDGMTDLDDYVDMSCVATGDKGESISWTGRVLANS